MHIEIGIISPEKLAYAGVAATAPLGAHTMGLLKSPTAWLRTALAVWAGWLGLLGVVAAWM